MIVVHLKTEEYHEVLTNTLFLFFESVVPPKRFPSGRLKNRNALSRKWKKSNPVLLPFNLLAVISPLLELCKPNLHSFIMTINKRLSIKA